MSTVRTQVQDRNNDRNDVKAEKISGDKYLRRKISIEELPKKALRTIGRVLEVRERVNKNALNCPLKP